ncbi:hypothetical protein INT45_008566 [Circinella minor]|uniref:Uncharacterized protein n=1 Tax=Circinella minor TaxID=1195481 RepID=A0A8H7RWI1_9FUNG|nr:hypothetical protein INT45_008566 [Circinella minor]
MYISPYCNALFRVVTSRDRKGKDIILEKVADVQGYTYDLISYLNNTNDDASLVIIDYSGGLSTNIDDLK